MDSSDDEQNVASEGATTSDEEKTFRDDDKLSKRNTGWADAMAKVLKQTKPAGKRAIVLSRAKRIQDVKQEEPKEDFEIVGETKSAVPNDEVEEKKPLVGKKLMMKEYQVKGRVKPDILEKDREKMLAKIATRGVVQLFNAVRQQQKSVERTVKKAGKSERKREKLLGTIDRRKFLDVLAQKSTIPEVKSEEEENMEDAEEGNTWKVLSDDFMMNPELQNWDKLEEGEEEVNVPKKSAKSKRFYSGARSGNL